MTVSLYKKLSEDIKSQIIAGIYKEGDVLPSENDLMKISNTARSTVRQALNELVKDGYINKRQGYGSVVCKLKRKTLGLLSIKGFTEVVGVYNQPVKTIMLHNPTIRSWDNSFFYSLSDIEKAAGCIYLSRLRCTGDEPIMLESTYIPNLNLPKICNLPFINGSLFETLNVRYNIEITNVEQDLRAIRAGEEAAKRLNIAEGDPLLHIYLKFHTNKEHLYIYGSLFCNTTNYSIGNKL